MVETIESMCPAAAKGKLKPKVHGPCTRDLGADASKHIMTYFALLPVAGTSVGNLAYAKLNWPVEELCISIHSMLQSFAASDPATSRFKFYHGDTNYDNYVVPSTGLNCQTAEIEVHIEESFDI